MDYSKVIMVGMRWATRAEDGSLTMFDSAEEAAGGESVASEDEQVNKTQEDEISQADIVDAIAAIADRSEEPLKKRPNVTDIEAELGEGADVSATECDDAWDIYNK